MSGIKGTRFNHIHSSSGFGLIEALVSVGISLVVIMGIYKLVNRTEKIEKDIDFRFQIAQIQQMVRSRLSCTASLGVGPGTTLPLNCASFANVKLRDQRSEEIFANGKYASWTVSGTCVDDNIVIRAQRQGMNPLTNKPWSQSSYAQDLFNGTSDFCHKFFASSGSCQNPYSIQVGWSNGNPTCCREQIVFANTIAPYVAEAQCAANEYLKAGGGSCWWGAVGWSPPPGSSLKVINFGPVPISHADLASNKWVYDCQTNDPTIDQYAKTTALCCPKNQ